MDVNGAHWQSSRSVTPVEAQLHNFNMSLLAKIVRHACVKHGGWEQIEIFVLHPIGFLLLKVLLHLKKGGVHSSDLHVICMSPLHLENVFPIQQEGWETFQINSVWFR